MIESPFAIFRPFEDRVRIRLYDRSDKIHSRNDLLEREGLPLADAKQPHGKSTAVVRAGTTERAAHVDGLATDVHGIALTVRGQDCQIFVAYDPTKNIGGVLHAGWRGLVAGAIPAFIDTLCEMWGTDPADLVVGAGPSLCMQCSEFTDPLRELPGIDPRFFKGRLVDLQGIAHTQLMRAGVHEQHIERHPDCTKCMGNRWWSWRGGDKEAMLAGAQNALTFSLL